MRRPVACSITLVAVYLTSCVSSHPPIAGMPTPVAPIPATIPTATATWNFQFAPGLITYRISRSATITEQTASPARRETSNNSTFESLTIQPAGDTIGFTAVVDTFSTTTQGATSPVPSVPLPLQLSGALTGDSIIFSTDSLAQICSPVVSALITDLHNVLPHFPGMLTASTSWKDSTRSVGCQGSIPTRSQTLHSY